MLFGSIALTTGRSTLPYEARTWIQYTGMIQYGHGDTVADREIFLSVGIINTHIQTQKKLTYSSF